MFFFEYPAKQRLEPELFRTLSFGSVVQVPRQAMILMTLVQDLYQQMVLQNYPDVQRPCFFIWNGVSNYWYRDRMTKERLKKQRIEVYSLMMFYGKKSILFGSCPNSVTVDSLFVHKGRLVR